MCSELTHVQGTLIGVIDSALDYTKMQLTHTRALNTNIKQLLILHFDFCLSDC